MNRYYVLIVENRAYLCTTAHNKTLECKSAEYAIKLANIMNSATQKYFNKNRFISN